MENENLKNIIEQYKRSVKSLDDEIELHKLNQSEHDKLVQKEKQYVKCYNYIVYFMSIFTLCYLSECCRRSAELEKELNFIKSKYVRLLSEQFKIAVPSK